MLLILGQALDVLTFLIYQTLNPQNGTTEQNFLISFVFSNFGILGFVLLKLGYGGWIRYRLGKSGMFHWKVYSVLAVAAASGFVGAVFNSWAIVK